MVWPLALWLTLFGNLPLWQRVADVSTEPTQLAQWFAALGVGVLGITVALLSLLSWPRLFRPAASALVLISALNTHFMWQYGTVMDPTMMANVLHTDAREVRDLLSPPLFLTLLLLAAPPLFWIWSRPTGLATWWPQALRNTLGITLGLLLAAGATLAGYQGLASLMRNHKPLRYLINPHNSLYGMAHLMATQLPRQVRPLQPVGEDAHPGTSYTRQLRPPLLVLVVGETARAQSWGLNGYDRPTTPQLARWQDKGLVNFSDVTSCGTNTQVSVPCLFSARSRSEGGNSGSEQENLLDILQRAGLAVLWLDNQSGCKGVCDRVPSARVDGPDRSGRCEGSTCFDEALLDNLEQRLQGLDAQRRARGVVLVMHQMGSHGPAYFRRTPAEHKAFLPECTSNNLSDCPPQALVNAYDNTIAYTDHFLGQTLTWLRTLAEQGIYDTGLLYVSDHGESLGENGLYLHGVPYALAPDQQTRVPMATWLSEGLQRRTGVHTACLRARAAAPLSHDHVFHSVLGLMDIQTAVHQRSLDLYAPCAGR